MVRAAYLEMSVREIRRRAREAVEGLRACRVCPRDCDADRLGGEVGQCNTGRRAVVGSHFPHFGEEDVLRGRRGSGTIFFALCNLRCIFCQNWDISQKKRGTEVGPRDLADLMIDLQDRGCHNINFVTPEHVVPQVLEALPHAIERGLRLPIVYNTSAYDSLHSIELMDGIVDIYLPDFKFWDPEKAFRYSRARDYPEVARRVIRAMHDQVGDLVVGPDGMARRGLILRHLVMPGGVEDGREIVRWVAREVSTGTWTNVMGQYRPEYKAERREEIDRRPRSDEVRAVERAAREAGLHRLDRREPAHLRSAR